MATAEQRVANYIFADIYRLLINKIERKGRAKPELDIIICWLTGYTQEELQKQIDGKVNYKLFFDNAPQINPNSSKITGKICGCDVQQITDPFMQKVRFLDKLADELAKGKPLEKILKY